uniref:Protein-serine/threonine kinase n=2 Tax=Lotharella globosa TaxID=91324 RepID=A0A7S3YZW8_9EUKA
MQYLLQDNTEVVQTMALGVIQARRSIQEKDLPDFRRLVDLVLVRFFTARIGLRFIIEQFIASREYKTGFAGVIESFCNPVLIAQRAAEDASQLCKQHKDVAPKVLFHTPGANFSEDLQFTYVPHHLHYMLTEILKNSMRATVECHDPSNLPPIKVVFVAGNEDTTIKVIDEGGGIRRSEIETIWNFFHSTAEAPIAGTSSGPSSEELGHWMDVLRDRNNRENGGPSIPPSALAGYGVGLPLSRLFARYFGGDITISSMEGFGTDAYLHIPRLGTNCESLPAPVQTSPGEKDSTYVPYPGYVAY